MLDKFFVDSANGVLVVERWIDEMPVSYRDVAADACVEAFEQVVGRKANNITMQTFVDVVHKTIIEDPRIKL